MSLRNELQSIYEQTGFLTAQVVVDAAVPEDSPLHDRFEWDDSIAGPLYRLEQARDLIRSFTVRYRQPNSETEETVRFYHSVREESGQVYRSLDDIKESEFLTKLVLNEAERAWRDLLAKYGHMAEFLEVVKADIAV